MGFWDALGELASIAKDIVLLPAEITKAAGECVTDIGEAITQDAQNKLSGTPDKEIRTSFDIRDEAEKIVASANRDFNDAKDELTASWRSTSQEAVRVAEKREEVYQLLGKTISAPLVKLPEQPIGLVYPSNAPYVDSSFDVGTFFGLLGIRTRMDAAEEYLQQAQEYRVKVGGLINQMESLRRAVLNVSDAQEEELGILNMIRVAYRRQNRIVLSQSADLLHSIAVLCVQEVSSNTNAKYRELLKKLKSLWF